MSKASVTMRALLITLMVVATFCFLEGQAPSKKPAKTAPRDDQAILHDIQELEQSLREAFVDGKSAWWDLHLDEHYAGLNPDGVMVRKSDLIQLYGSPDLQYEEMDLSDMSARIYENCVIASTRSAIKGAYKGHDFSGTYYFVHVWVKEDNDWKLANSQATKLPG